MELSFSEWEYKEINKGMVEVIRSLRRGEQSAEAEDYLAVFRIMFSENNPSAVFNFTGDQLRTLRKVITERQQYVNHSLDQVIGTPYFAYYGDDVRAEINEALQKLLSKVDGVVA
jgi:hypothetical protein